jgi:hypothetical protein
MVKLINAKKTSLSNLVNNVKQTWELAIDQKVSRSYYPELERKGRARTFLDLLRWLVRYREVNSFYYVHGLDRKNADMSSVLPYRIFRQIRNRRNLNPTGFSDYYGSSHNYVCMLRDKFVFSQYASSLGFPIPKNFAICSPDSLIWLDPPEKLPLVDLIKNSERDIDAFCKPLVGIMGKEVFSLKVQGGKLFMDEKQVTLEDFKRRLRYLFLLQERVVQHPKLNALYPRSINTVRIVTFNNGGQIEVISTVLRIGASEKRTDNWASGGIIVKVNQHTGKLQGEGFFKPGFGFRTQRHPDTGITLEGYDVPYLLESIELVIELHKYFYAIHSVGWDVAISEEGPLILEGNDDWDGAIPMTVDDEFSDRFMAMYSAM